jgi:hypothetical protein
MTITPDTKDWTWVVELRCPECGFDANTIPASEVAARLRAELALWQAALADETAGERPGPTTWSSLEYGCHVRDVCALYDKRLHLMLDEDDPLFDNWDQDETAVGQRYGEQEPAEVLAELISEAERLAASFDTVTAEQWQRPGRRSDGAVFTIDTFARYLLHDVVHHGWDVTGVEASE